ncbi:MAG: universal stress protein [Rhodospirillaceae bacterium]
MSFKDILVIVDNTKSCAQRLDVALHVAKEHGAHLTALFVRTVPHVPQFVMSQLGPEVADVQKRYAKEAATAARAVFDAKTRNCGVNTEWRETSGVLIDQCLLHAKYSDLVIAGQTDAKDDSTAEGQADLLDHLVLEAGRPVLLVPFAGQFTAVGQRVLVAWNGTREAARALNDALPMLKKADNVHVIAVNPRGGNGRDGHGEVPSADIALHLARHGVKAEANAVDSDGMSAGEALVARAAKENIDLIVMGAYGRSRLRELVLGGATRHMLRNMTVPVLMSH